MDGIPDLHKAPRFQGESVRAKTVLSEGEVSVDTSREEKPFAALPAGRQASYLSLGMNELCVSRVNSHWDKLI